MKMRVQLVIEDASGARTSADIAAIERRTDDLIGLSLEEAKAMTGALQRKMVEAQARELVVHSSTCSQCQSRLRRNGTHRICYRTPFGRLDLDSPRFYRCRCQNAQSHQLQSARDLALHAHQSRASVSRSSLLSYDVSARMLGTVLPLERATSITSIAAVPALNEFGLPKR
jgi:hypothetical protein